ncbi:NAD(P)/FAD-dependent oxidoreductase [Larsenimonas salina]|uniref:NAD(P)/FAD-dependent oxidoreductase n=1 Tax=Larsenimonas salina TaxID=1295565 RepID=UPI002073B194|nr:FAD-dependent oxidoreductase [Larsenimonas salina]MCM5705499.1 FAD-dependent oxidoreductase [Larsenimonas salina]
MASPKIAVIGAGISGLSAAQTISRADLSVSVFEKARGPGGRMSSRRERECTIDLGVPCFSARSTEFKRTVERWLSAGIISHWPLSPKRLKNRQIHNYDMQHLRFAGNPRMSAITRYMSQGLNVTTQAHVSAIEYANDQVYLELENGQRAGPFDHVILALPPKQAFALLPESEQDLKALCSRTAFHPCWNVHAVLNEFPELDWDALYIESGPIGFAEYQSAKPGRENSPAIRLIARPEWSRTHLEKTPDVIAATLWHTFLNRYPDPLPGAIRLKAHRWRYAEPLVERRSPEHHPPSSRHLSVCGDWCLGNNVEAAWLSGRTCARNVLARLLSN